MTKPIVEIDSSSGFCNGVVAAINKAEDHIAQTGTLYCLGDIVHNSDEVNRLRDKGLTTITHETMATLHDVSVLLRAHGEPPETYALARKNNITVIDATCPVVLKLQRRIKEMYDRPAQERPQIVIYGKKGHAEVNGLVGQTCGEAIVVEDISGLDAIDYSRPIALYSQTTKSLEGFKLIIEEIQKRKSSDTRFEYFDTICRQVANRVGQLRHFAAEHDVVIFVAGAKSSNGKILYGHCHDVNPRTYLISDIATITHDMLKGATTIGICGATSTPRWLMEEARNRIVNMLDATI